MLRFLIVYATTDEPTSRVATAVARTLQDESARVTVLDAAWEDSNIRPERFDGVIVAASFHAGGCQPTVKRWMVKHANALRHTAGAFISVCLRGLHRDSNVDRELVATIDRCSAQTGWTPSMREVVAGAQPDTKSSVSTNWADLGAFTQEFVRSVRLGSAVPVASRQLA